MNNRKETCEASRTCETGKTFNGVSSFFLMPVYNNRYDPRFINPRTEITTGVIQNLNTNRVEAEFCENDTKQAKLSLRRKPTPYRVPFNHYRKTYNCNTTGCIPNEKIIKVVDNSQCEVINGLLTQICSRPNYAVSRQVNKFGFKTTNNGGNYKNYLQNSGKLYEQNTFGVLPENKADKGIFEGKKNLYKINTVNGLSDEDDCKLAYKRPISLTQVSIQQQKMDTTTRKYRNPGYNSRTSVTSRNRIQRLKYNANIGSQNNRNGYNNCINGQECSKYTNPGPNTKLFSLGSIYNVQNKQWESQECQATRINGMKQSCLVPPPPPPTNPCDNGLGTISSASLIGANTTPTDPPLNGAYFQFDISCPLSSGDTIKIIFTTPGYPSTPSGFGRFFSSVVGYGLNKFTNSTSAPGLILEANSVSKTISSNEIALESTGIPSTYSKKESLTITIGENIDGNSTIKFTVFDNYNNINPNGGNWFGTMTWDIEITNHTSLTNLTGFTI